MRVLLTTIQHYTDRPSGSSRLAYDQALYLASAGHSVYVLAPELQKERPECEELGNVCLLRYTPRRFYLGDPRRASAHQTAAKEVLRRNLDLKIDAIHGHAPLSFIAASEVFPEARKFYSIHSPLHAEMEINWRGGISNAPRRWFGLPLLNRLERKCIRISEVVTAESDFTRREMRRLHGQRIAEKVKVVPGWVDLDRFRILPDRAASKVALGWPSDAPVLFTLRRLEPRMGLDRLIRAVRIVRDRGQQTYLVIGGAGALEPELRQLVTTLDLDASVRLVGRVPDADLPAMYGACDAFVLPTAELECFGLIALEALSCGRPVLATPVGAIPEVMNNFEPQWLARSASEDDIAGLIGGFLERRLPSHSPSELRAKAGELYSSDRRLSELVNTILSPMNTGTRADRLRVKTAYSGQGGE